ncbi:hypothetical protein BCR36DRAFT_374611 [Piromyces finnis]|uniref:L domain-like protein n=1 Tax=Piromyces finnis TaxID=1754191 RepID=A0A1Y1UWA3_9FUNG|nr:hypothetical protein BCR36DRAFT_375612 [Piromyces finnis]ORX42296.1 hypothetical protein BCR36DRAFT_374608 [Piromyces finnis]ORX42299.1 hypothetical protein BCR36DRAFT_374611 [Piromyces finnis]|eukprot:ORX38769.1 hypothetical protein BCR36DRAFT_375612 [Piromyces finnis]
MFYDMINRDLSDQGYHGSLPSELGNLSNLQYIYLSNNAFTGSIPSEFGNLLKLEILSLRDNLLSGFIPPELGRDIRNNGFSGSIPQEILNNNISKFFHDNYNDKNKQVVEKEEKNDLNKDAKSDNGTNPFLIIAIVFGIISIILTILIFLVLRKNRDLKKKNNERNSFSTLNKVHINSTSISGNGESSTNLPDIPLNSVNESNYIKSLNHTNNNNTIIGGEEDLLPSYEDILNENGEHNTGNMHDSTSNFIKE